MTDKKTGAAPVKAPPPSSTSESTDPSLFGFDNRKWVPGESQEKGYNADGREKATKPS